MSGCHGQHVSCPVCGTAQPVNVGGALAGHGRMPQNDRWCAGSGMTARQRQQAEKDTAGDGTSPR